jgi:alkaline phosphatase D
MPLTRRQFLINAALFGAALPLAAACGEDEEPKDDPMMMEEELPELPDYEWTGTPGPETLFSHSVASGDPLADAVILWTRVTPASTGAPVRVWWEIARDVAFEERVAAAEVTTDASRDFTVKVDAKGLRAGRTYYYRFFAEGRQSPVGRTKTAPVGEVKQVRMGVASCSNYASGYFLAYRELAAADLDVVLHLGDYIYEYGGGGFGDDEGVMRAHEPNTEILSLSDYRTRYAQYRRDPDLKEVHRQHPFIIVWDDHESANDAWNGGAQNHDPALEGMWAMRRANAEQAWREWQPVREQADGRIWRSFAFGDLIDLVMLDTRLWGREEQVNGTTAQRAAERTLLGQDQEQWLYDNVTKSEARWFVVGQQVMMGQLKPAGRPNSAGGGTILNGDQWDGYWAGRDRFFATVRAAQEKRDRSNLVVLTGDIHTSWAIDLTEDPNNSMFYDKDTGKGAVGVEFVTPGVTSPGLPFLTASITATIYRQNPHIRWFDVVKRGYMVLDITPERVQNAWHHFDDIRDPQGASRFAGAYSTRLEAPGLQEDMMVAAARAEAPALAPV